MDPLGPASRGRYVRPSVKYVDNFKKRGVGVQDGRGSFYVC